MSLHSINKIATFILSGRRYQASGLNMSHLEIELKLSVRPETIKRIREKIISFSYYSFLIA